VLPNAAPNAETKLVSFAPIPTVGLLEDVGAKSFALVYSAKFAARIVWKKSPLQEVAPPLTLAVPLNTEPQLKPDPLLFEIQ
jgi:hypothetical protein